MRRRLSAKKKVLSFGLSICMMLSTLNPVMAAGVVPETNLSEVEVESADQETMSESDTAVETQSESETETETETETQSETQEETAEPESETDREEKSKRVDKASRTTMFSAGFESSVSSELPYDLRAQVAIIPGTDGSAYQTFGTNAAAYRSALFELYQNGGGGDYILYNGTTLTVPTGTGNKAIPTTVSATNVTFSSLEGCVGTLTLVSDYTDDLNTQTTGRVTTSKRLTLSATTYFGTNVVLRNIDYICATIYMQGHDLTMDYGSYEYDTLTVYGGTDSGNLVASPSIVVNATGDGLASFRGGNNSGTITGDISITINSTSAGIDTFYGGGYGSGATSKANVIGTVTSTIKGVSGNLGAYYGGVRYGDVSGKVSNTISGRGGHASTTAFYGGSYNGNIGTDETKGTDVIVNDIDFSQYTNSTNYRSVYGANNSTGNIKGNIVNTLTAGEYQKGYCSGFNGAGAPATTGGCSGSKGNSETNAHFRVYGNITSEVKKGCVGYSTTSEVNYIRGAGYGGYIEGDVTTEVGTEGLVYAKDLGNTDMTYKANRGNYTGLASRNGVGVAEPTGLDIFGGAGSGTAASSYIYGNTTLIQHNVLARWTYGGSYMGYIKGNTKNIVTGGTPKAKIGAKVHTLEGGGYQGTKVDGNCEAVLEDGQVDWFLSGGSWSDDLVTGNVTVNIYGGVINAHVGGVYGSGAVVVEGNAEINIYGGDFSGIAHQGASDPGKAKQIAGGASQTGTIKGNITVNIDYSNNPTEKFSLPAKAELCGGVPYGTTGGVIVGDANTETSITLNVKAGGDGNEDALAGVNIYGDGAKQDATYYQNSSYTLNKAEHIIMNIDAPGSSIGDLYATNSQHNLTKDVEINVYNAKSIDGINCGSDRGTSTTGTTASKDDFTTTRVNAAPNGNRAKVYIGAGVDEDPFEVTIGSAGIQNFTELIVDNAIFYSTGNVLNGSGIQHATVANRLSNYNSRATFGDITLKNEAGFGLAPNVYAAGGTLAIEGERSKITSSSGQGIFILNGYEPGDSSVEWVRNGGDGLYSHTGHWFGKAQFYRVFTFAPSANYGQAINVKPANFRGVNKADGKTYIGDNEVSNGYGLALPASIIEYKVVRDKGSISHDVDEVSEGPEVPIKVYGTVAKGVEAQEGMLAIPVIHGIEPTLTFTPAKKDANTPEYWVMNVNVTTTAVDKTGLEVDTPERQDYEVEKWTSPDPEYGYTALGKFSNDAEVTARDVIITESEAEAIMTADDLIEWMEAKGRPFFSHSITDQLLEDIRKPLPAGSYHRKHEVTYKAGVSETPNSIETKNNVIVVPDDAVFPTDPTDRSVALFAKDASMSVTEAQQLSGQEQLDKDYTKAFVYHANGTVESATLDGQTVPAIQGTTRPHEVNAPYSYTRDGETTPLLEKTVKVTIREPYVCKIDTTGYETIKDAVNAANLMTPAAGEQIKIEMLIDEYQMKIPVELKKDIVLTTASKYAATLPYVGDKVVATVYLANDLEDNAALFTITKGSFELTNLVLDGNVGGYEFKHDTKGAQDALIRQKAGGQGVVLETGAVIQNYKGAKSPVHNEAGNLTINGAILRKNVTLSDKGTIYNEESGNISIQSGSITGNSAKVGGAIYNDGSLIISGGTIKENIAQDMAGAIYQNGTMAVKGIVVISGNVKGSNLSTGTANNVYLPATSVREPLQKHIWIAEPLEYGSDIGVMTETSPLTSDKGTEFTIIGVPNAGVGNMENYFTHDQLAVNSDAYEVVEDTRGPWDPRSGGKNLVLGTKINGRIFSFTKIEATNGDNVGDLDKMKFLAGAKFTLYNCTNTEAGHTHDYLATDEVIAAGTCWQEYKKAQSDAQGEVNFGKIPDGEYILVETQAPSGYETPLGQWLVEISTTELTITAHSMYGPDTSDPGGEWTDPWDDWDSDSSATSGPDDAKHVYGTPPAFQIVSGGQVGGSPPEYYLPNFKEFKLPFSGNVGIYLFIITGVLFMSIAGGALWLRRKRSLVKARV